MNSLSFKKNLTKWRKFKKYRYCFTCEGYSDNNNGKLKKCTCKNNMFYAIINFCILF